MKTRLTITVVACSLLAVFTVYAQEAPPKPPFPGGPGPRGDERHAPEMQELVETVMAARLAKALDLSDEETVVMVRRFSEFKEQMRGFKARRQELMKALKMGLREKAPDERLEAALGELMKHDAEVEEYKRGAYDKACAGLSVAQRATLYVFLGEFEADIRQLIQKARARRAEHFGRFFGPAERGGLQEGQGRDQPQQGPSARPFGERPMRMGPPRQRRIEGRGPQSRPIQPPPRDDDDAARGQDPAP